MLRPGDGDHPALRTGAGTAGRHFRAVLAIHAVYRADRGADRDVVRDRGRATVARRGGLGGVPAGAGLRCSRQQSVAG